MWAKIEVFQSDRSIIYLPSAGSKDCEQTTLVIFGGISAVASIQYTDGIEFAKKSSFKNPLGIKLSSKLRDELLIVDSQIYQIKMSDSERGRTVFIGPVIGLLLGNDTNRYTPSHMKKYSDRFGIYHRIGGLIYAFSPKSINWRKLTAYGLYFNYSTASWEYGCFPLPEVIYRRDFHSNPEEIKKLLDFTGGRLFNSYRFSKYELFDCLKQNDDLNKYLPPTELSLCFDQVKEFIGRNSNVILKPVHLSRGRGICVIEKSDEHYKITDYRCKSPLISDLNNDESLKDFFSANRDLFDKYLIQKYLPLSKIGDSFFDIRVVMQKRREKTWGCTGIECRVSNNSHLTNISKGGFALPLYAALRQAFAADQEILTRQILKLCKKFCLYMDTLDEHFAEFGLDIAIDTDKNLWLIEANVFPSFHGFKKMDLQTYLSIRYTPLLYALSLTEFGERY